MEIRTSSERARYCPEPVGVSVVHVRTVLQTRIVLLKSIPINGVIQIKGEVRIKIEKRAARESVCSERISIREHLAVVRRKRPELYEHRKLDQIDAIGVDEIQYAKGHNYLTLVYQIDLGVTRLLWVGKERTIESFQGFFTAMGKQVISKISFVCSDMWEPYLKLIRQHCSEALHILDRFHIVANMNKALDQIRAEETGRLKREGRDIVLKKTRWLLLLRRSDNLGAEQHFRLRDLLRYNLKTVLFQRQLPIGYVVRRWTASDELIYPKEDIIDDQPLVVVREATVEEYLEHRPAEFPRIPKRALTPGKCFYYELTCE